MVTFVLFVARKFLFGHIIHQIKFTPNNGFNSAAISQLMFTCLCHKLEYAEHVAMVGNGKALHAVFSRLFVHGGNTGGPIQQRKLRMRMKVNEFWHYDLTYRLEVMRI